ATRIEAENLHPSCLSFRVALKFFFHLLGLEISGLLAEVCGIKSSPLVPFRKRCTRVWFIIIFVHWRNHQIPAHERERGGVADLHRACLAPSAPRGAHAESPTKQIDHFIYFRDSFGCGSRATDFGSTQAL